jgi:hypothetical protein
MACDIIATWHMRMLVLRLRLLVKVSTLIVTWHNIIHPSDLAVFVDKLLKLRGEKWVCIIDVLAEHYFIFAQVLLVLICLLQLLHR